MGTTRVWEGTWEEVLEHGREFAGHRVRLELLNDSEPPEPRGPDTASEAWLAAFRAWVDGHDDSREAIYADSDRG